MRQPHPSVSTILIVDDSPGELGALSQMLGDDYAVRAVRTGRRALAAVRSLPVPDLVLLDFALQDMDGYELLRQLQDDPETADIPVLFITAPGAEWDEGLALILGAAEYVSRPVRAQTLRNRVRIQLELTGARRERRAIESFVEGEVRRRTQDLSLAQDVCIRALALLSETSDPIGGNHLRRTQAYLDVLADQLARRPGYADLLTKRSISLLVSSAPLHDIGKMGLPKDILLKPGKLDAREWALAKTHSRLGRDAIALAAQGIERPLAFLDLAQEIAYSHHERWDGSGYPEGLSEDHIPVSARLMAVADVLDALVSHRAYKSAYSFGQAAEIIRQGRGSQFDPVVVDAFTERLDELEVITARLPDARSFSDPIPYPERELRP